MSEQAPANFNAIVPEVIFTAVERFGGRCTGRFLALNAMENRVYDVELEDDSHVVIKFYRPGRWSRATIAAEHQFLAEAVAAEVPVVCPLVDSAGESLFVAETIFYAVFPKRPGRLEAELNDAQLQRLGRYLGRLHNIGEKLRHVDRGRLDADTFVRGALTELLTLDVLPPELVSRYRDICTQIATIAEPRLQNTPYILTHGDCHVGNILWNGDNPYFIDFDDMLHAPPVQDIWMLTGGNDEDGHRRREVLLGAYEQMRAFDHDTLSLIETLRALRMVNFATWIAKRWDDQAFKRGFPEFGTYRYWQDHFEGLTMQLERIR